VSIRRWPVRLTLLAPGSLGAALPFRRSSTQKVYSHVGSNSDLGLKDYATLEGEAGYRLTERFLPTISLWWSAPPADDASNLMEARLKGTYRMADDVSLEGYLGTGLSDGAADFGAGLAVFYRF
jgi:hypothetical protein